MPPAGRQMDQSDYENWNRLQEKKTCCDRVIELWCGEHHTPEQMLRAFRKHQYHVHNDTRYNKDGKIASKSHTGNGRHKGLWAGTLTKAPTDPISEADMITAINKLMAQKSCPVVKYAWYLERKEDGLHPHVHFLYETETGGRITQRTFQRVWSIWDEKKEYKDSNGKYKGHRGGYHKEVADLYAYKDYISKDGGLHGTQGFHIEDFN